MEVPDKWKFQINGSSRQMEVPDKLKFQTNGSYRLMEVLHTVGVKVRTDFYTNRRSEGRTF